MGLTRGTEIKVKNVAPLGDPIHIAVRDFELSLRADEAEALLLQPTETAGAHGHGIPGQGPWRRWRRHLRRHEGQPHEGWPEHKRHRHGYQTGGADDG